MPLTDTTIKKAKPEQGYKTEWARLALQRYTTLTPRNGRYKEHCRNDAH